MSSVAQISLGILILGAAFIIGNQLRNQHKVSVVAESADEASEEIVWQRPEVIETPQAESPVHNGLIDLPVAKRRVSNPLPARDDRVSPITGPEPKIAPAPKTVLTLPPPPLSTTTTEVPLVKRQLQDVEPTPVVAIVQNIEVEPDFSHLENIAKTDKDQPPPMVAAGDNNMNSNQLARESVKLPNRDLASPQLVKKIPIANSVLAIAPPPNRELTPATKSVPSNAPPPATELVPAAKPILAIGPPPSTNPMPSIAAPSVAESHQTPATNRVNSKARSRLVRLKPKSKNRIVLETNQFVRHQTEQGETLQKLSTKYYGKPDYYLDIYLANQDVLENPGNVPMGTTLRIPLYE